MLPDELYQAASRSTDIAFYCSYGHKLAFTGEKKRSNVVPLRIVKNEQNTDEVG
jgi:hypothetical protein